MSFNTLGKTLCVVSLSLLASSAFADEIATFNVGLTRSKCWAPKDSSTRSCQVLFLNQETIEVSLKSVSDEFSEGSWEGTFEEAGQRFAGRIEIIHVVVEDLNFYALNASTWIVGAPQTKNGAGVIVNESLDKLNLVMLASEENSGECPSDDTQCAPGDTVYWKSFLHFGSSAAK
jgi:hypothetical protein